MLKTRTLVAVGLVAALASPGPVSAHGSHTITNHEGSHEHPKGANTSLLCTKFQVPGAHRVVVIASGPAVDEPKKAVRARGDATDRRRVRVTWDIRAPGDYDILVKLMRRKKVIRRSRITYTVPNGPPAVGPFPCS